MKMNQVGQGSLGKLKIMQIAPIGLPVGPDIKYGGTERVIGYLDKVFTKQGHNSVVAASGDSEVYGELLETIPKSTWNIIQGESSRREMTMDKDWYYQHYKRCIEFILSDGVYSEKIDIIHDQPGSGIITSEEYEQHKDEIDIPILSTLHGAFSCNDKKYEKWKGLKKEKRKVFFNAISNSQKREFEKIGVGIEDVVYHGLPIENFALETNKSDYLFLLGRISPEKGQHIAIEIAKKTGMPLVIAGEVHSSDEDYWKEMIEPYIDGDQIKFVGSKTDAEKIPLYQKAAAFIFPLQWSEPFGLIMIEAMSCGTPVIAYSRGSVPEVVEHGKTGFVIQETGNREKDLEAMVRAVDSLDSINPKDCRKRVEDNFTIEKEADNYLRLYERLINSS